MTIGIFLFAVFAGVLISSALAWTLHLVKIIPATQDIMPLLPAEQFFIVLARQRKEQ